MLLWLPLSEGRRSALSWLSSFTWDHLFCPVSFGTILCRCFFSPIFLTSFEICRDFFRQILSEKFVKLLVFTMPHSANKYEFLPLTIITYLEVSFAAPFHTVPLTCTKSSLPPFFFLHIVNVVHSTLLKITEILHLVIFQLSIEKQLFKKE